MVDRRLTKILALLLVLVVALAIPLAGCKKATEPPASEGAGDTGGTSGGTSGGTGGDPSAGNELGTWGAWQSSWAAGQHYRYTINNVIDGQNTAGWYELTFSDAGGGKLKVDYSGNVGIGFSGSFVADDAQNINWSTGISDIMAWAMLLGLMVTPGLTLGFAEHSWDVGTNWSFGTGEDAVTFEISAKKSFAGITGAYGEWKDAKGGGCEFCVNPNVPLALYLKLVTDEKNYMEYILTECSGF